MLGKPAWAREARTGPLRRHKKLVIFACEGLIALYDESTDEEDYHVYTPAEMQERVDQMAILAEKMKKSDVRWQRQEGAQWLYDFQGIRECIKEAREMGDPSDPQVQAFWARHRRSTTVKISWSSGTIPAVPLGKFTGRTTGPPDKQFSSAEALLLNAPRVRTLPTRKPRPGQAKLILPEGVL